MTKGQVEVGVTGHNMPIAHPGAHTPRRGSRCGKHGSLRYLDGMGRRAFRRAMLLWVPPCNLRQTHTNLGHRLREPPAHKLPALPVDADNAAGVKIGLHAEVCRAFIAVAIGRRKQQMLELHPVHGVRRDPGGAGAREGPVGDRSLTVNSVFPNSKFG